MTSDRQRAATPGAVNRPSQASDRQRAATPGAVNRPSETNNVR